jgi:calcineurin-like phosphoesterase family protein
MNNAFQYDRSAPTAGWMRWRSFRLIVFFICPSAHTLGYDPVDFETNVVVAAGDISCDPSDSRFNHGQGTRKYCHMHATSNLAVSMKPVAVLILGDSQYEKGAATAFQQSWIKNWGRDELRNITYPSVGNHEYYTLGASGYFDFFGARAGDRDKGYYSFDIGSWHLIALNTGSNDQCKPLSCDENSSQEKWLREDLKNSDAACTLAFWHRPLFTSGHHRNAVEVRPFWRDLYNAGADVILNGHAHQYERFAPQTADGVTDQQRGLTQFVVGTGGKNLTRFWRKQANSVVRISNSYGILRLELRTKSYAWQFVSEEGNVLDSGEMQCHGKQ